MTIHDTKETNITPKIVSAVFAQVTLAGDAITHGAEARFNQEQFESTRDKRAFLMAAMERLIDRILEKTKEPK